MDTTVCLPFVALFVVLLAAEMGPRRQKSGQSAEQGTDDGRPEPVDLFIGVGILMIVMAASYAILVR